MDIGVWKHNLYNFTDLAMRYCEQTRLVSKWHVGYLCEILTAVQRKQLNKVNIIIPPGHTKTFLITRAFIPYLLGHDPNARCFYVRRKHDLAEHEMSVAKRFMLSEIYQAIFPEVTLDKKGDGKFTILNSRGFAEAKGVEAAITGASADFLACDDIVDAGDSTSVCETICNNITGGFFTRLRDNEHSTNYGIVFVNQRLGTQDQTAFLRERYNFNEFIIPFIETAEKTYSFGNFIYHRKEGEVLNPQITTIEKVKARIGDWDKNPYVANLFETQYQQNPIQSDQSIIKLEWIKDTTLEELKHKTFDFVYISCDTAQKTGKLNDYSAITVWGVLDNRYYVIDVHRKKLETPDLRKLISDLYFDCNADRVLIEDHANGTAIASELKRGVLRDGKQININLEAIKVSKDKAERLNACSIVFNDGLVYIPKDALWRRDFVNELTNFPNVKHDDQCDSVSLFLNWHRSRMKPMRFFSNY